MYIKEITLDGFKSYAQRVTLTNFDKSFNAITGLNGSGKSNILDSICFVLGISQLQRVGALPSCTQLHYLRCCCCRSLAADPVMDFMRTS
jgi:recombinational DNA repair ATPase RecF